MNTGESKMKKGVIIGLIVIGLLLVIFLIFMIILSEDTGKYVHEIKFTEDKLITNQTIINMIVDDMKSPNGNNLTKLVIHEIDPNIMDDGGKIGYYVCVNGEHRGWIYYSGGEGLIKPGLYGPYEWCYI